MLQGHQDHQDHLDHLGQWVQWVQQVKEVTQVHWVLLVTAVLLDQLDSQVNLGLLVQVAQLDHLALEETQAPLVAQVNEKYVN